MELEVKYVLGVGLEATPISGNEEFTFSERVNAYKMAIMQLEDYCQETAEEVQDNEFGAYAWCLTGEFLRPENNTDLLRLLYFKQLITGSSDRISRIHLKTYLPRWWVKAISKKGIDIRYNLIDLIRSRFFLFIKTLYWILKIIFKNILCALKNKTTTLFPSLVDINAGPQDNRLDEFSNYINKKCAFFSGQEHKIIGVEKERIIEFRTYLTLKDLWLTLVRLGAIMTYIKTLKNKIPEPWYDYLSRLLSAAKLYDLLLYEKAVGKFIKGSQVKSLVHVSTLTKPTYRALWRACAKNKVNLALVGSRTFKLTSCSDRLIQADAFAYNQCAIPKYIIVKDDISKKTIDLRKRNAQIELIKGSRFANTEILGKLPRFEADGVILYIVLTHLKKTSEEMLRVLENGLKHLESKVNTLVFRSHPSNHLSISELKHRFFEYNIFDHTGQDYYNLNGLKNRVIGLSGPSTAGFELSRFVDLNLWIPFVWVDGILFHEVLAETDRVCKDEEELYHQFSLINKSYPLKRNIRMNGSNKLISEILEDLKLL